MLWPSVQYYIMNTLFLFLLRLSREKHIFAECGPEQLTPPGSGQQVAPSIFTGHQAPLGSRHNWVPPGMGTTGTRHDKAPGTGHLYQELETGQQGPLGTTRPQAPPGSSDQQAPTSGSRHHWTQDNPAW